MFNKQNYKQQSFGAKVAEFLTFVKIDYGHP